MDRRIAGFHQDTEQHWVARLECGHELPVRHDPPWEVRRWVLTPRGRSDRIGTILPCHACDFQLSPDDQRRFQVTLESLLEWYKHASPEELAAMDEANSWCGTMRMRPAERPSYEPWSGQGLQVLLTRALAEAIAHRVLPAEIHGELVVRVAITAEGHVTAALATTPIVPDPIRDIVERVLAGVTSATAAASQALYLLRY